MLNVAGCAVCASAAPNNWRIGGCAGCCRGRLTVFCWVAPPCTFVEHPPPRPPQRLWVDFGRCSESLAEPPKQGRCADEGCASTGSVGVKSVPHGGGGGRPLSSGRQLPPPPPQLTVGWRPLLGGGGIGGGGLREGRMGGGGIGGAGAHGRLRATPLATNCWPEALGGGGGSWRPRTRGVAPPPPGVYPECPQKCNPAASLVLRCNCTLFPTSWGRARAVSMFYLALTAAFSTCGHRSSGGGKCANRQGSTSTGRGATSDHHRRRRRRGHHFGGRA